MQRSGDEVLAGARTNGPAIRTSDLSFVYFGSDRYALYHVNFEVSPGDFVGIIGPSQAGKTTLCYALTGLIPHDVVGQIEGKVYVNGIDTATMQVYELSKQYGFVFDNPEYQLSQASVEEEVALGLENRGVDPDEMDNRIDEALKLVGLEDLRHRSPFELSGGQEQRLAIATMLALKPSILILDEPTSFLDPRGKEEVYATLRSLHAEGLTIVLVDHEVDLMASAVERLFVMAAGQFVVNGAPREVFAQIDRMDALGLRVPQSSEVVARIMGVEHVPLTVNEAFDSLTVVLKGKKKN